MIYYDFPNELYLLFVGSDFSDFLNFERWGKNFAIEISPESGIEFTEGSVLYEGKSFIMGLGDHTNLPMLLCTGGVITLPLNPSNCRQKIQFALQHDIPITVKISDGGYYDII